jgi:ADP-heptose:LPS heptosyltransferase
MKILIGLIEHFGDVVACEPVTRYLRAKYPDAHLSWAIQKPYRELIDSNPNIDEAVILGCLTDWIKLYKHSRNANTYDLIIDLHVNYRWCEECRVPLVKEQGNPFVNTFEWFDYGALLEAFCVGAGLPKLSAQPKLYIKDEHRSAVDALQLPPHYCVIHRDSNSAPKDWPDEKWLALVRFLNEELKLPVVEVGSQKYLTAHRHGAPWDKAASRMPLAPLVIDLMNRTKLLETAEVIRRARFFIGIDSGPAHLANATETPGVVLLGQLGYFRQYTPFTGYYASQSPEVRLLRNLTGPVAGLSVDEVIQATRELHRIIKCPNRCETEPAPGIASVASPDDRRAVLKAGIFDRAWYVTHYPEALKASVDPLDYFITVGAQRGHSVGAQQPSPVTEDSPSAERMAATLGSLSSQFKMAASAGESLPRIFAFYSPQPHWDSITQAKPLFEGHDQPRLPGELGCYDLCKPDVLREQVRLANEHGIAGFCFYLIQGNKLLETYIKSDIDAPFFLCADEPNDQSIRELLSLFADNRYVKVNGKPILAIANTRLLPNINTSTERWRQEAVKNGFPGLYLVIVDDASFDPIHPRELGFDASYELPSTFVTEETLLPNRDHGRIVDYRKFASFHMGRPFPNYKRFRTVMAPWDNTPRSGIEATVHVNTDNDAYKLWLAEALVDTNRRYARDERIVFLHSWNQWCDGTHVEPDGRSGRRLLEETKEVVDSLEPLIALDQNQADPKVAVLYQRLMREKEEGAARSLQAMRQQNMHLHRELERTIGEIHQAFYKTRSWRLTKPFRALARVLNKSDGL